MGRSRRHISCLVSLCVALFCAGPIATAHTAKRRAEWASRSWRQPLREQVLPPGPLWISVGSAHRTNCEATAPAGRLPPADAPLERCVPAGARLSGGAIPQSRPCATAGSANTAPLARECQPPPPAAASARLSLPPLACRWAGRCCLTCVLDSSSRLPLYIAVPFFNVRFAHRRGGAARRHPQHAAAGVAAAHLPGAAEPQPERQPPPCSSRRSPSTASSHMRSARWWRGLTPSSTPSPA